MVAPAQYQSDTTLRDLRSLRIGVIGAGVFGAWIAHELQRLGCTVTLFDQYGPGNARASSGGESRLLRAFYGTNTLYSEWAVRSHPLWLETLHAASHAECFVRCGALSLCTRADTEVSASLAAFETLQWPVQRLDRESLQRRYAVIALSTDCQGVLEPHSGALLGRRAVAAVVADFVRRGGAYVQARVLLDDTGVSEAVLAEGILWVDGERQRFDRVVVSAGAWLPKLLPRVIGQRLRPTRQEVFFFAVPAGSRDYLPASLPVWIDFTDARTPYGCPDIEGRGFKLAFHRHGALVDPDTLERCASAALVAESREYLAVRFPALASLPLLESRVCQYENTDSGDFILDWHPDNPRVFIAGGGSGHGFKHGPAVGRHVAQVLTGQENVIPRCTIPQRAAGGSEVR